MGVQMYRHLLKISILYTLQLFAICKNVKSNFCAKNCQLAVTWV